jgi:hypothetical protein
VRKSGWQVVGKLDEVKLLGLAVLLGPAYMQPVTFLSYVSAW